MGNPPRPRGCIDCGTLVKMWDLDEAAVCDDCVDARRKAEDEATKSTAAGGRQCARNRGLIGL